MNKIIIFLVVAFTLFKSYATSSALEPLSNDENPSSIIYKNLCDKIFFSHPDLKISFKVFEQDKLVKVGVLGELGNERRMEIVNPFIAFKGWQYYDEGLHARKLFSCRIFFSEVVYDIPEPYPRRKKFLYVLKNVKMPLPNPEDPDKFVGVISEYYRPDRTIFTQYRSFSDHF